MGELKEEILSSSLNASVKDAVRLNLNRKLIKKVYMPLWENSA
jgi:hypothetical protein